MISNTIERLDPGRLFLQSVEKKFPGDLGRLSRMSLIEGKFRSLITTIFLRWIFIMAAEGVPQQVRMANLACIGSRKVNGVAEVRIMHSHAKLRTNRLGAVAA